MCISCHIHHRYCKLSAGWRPLFQRHKTISTFKELEEFCLKNKSMVSIYDEYGRRYTWKQYFKKVYNHSQRKQSQGNGYMILILFFQIMVLDYIWHHVQSRKRKYICHSVIENTTRRKNWRRNVLDLPNSSHHSIFFHAHENVPSPIFPSRSILYDRMAYIFPLVNFAKGVDNICMNILI